MKKLITYASIISCIIFGSISCSEFLDVIPDNTPSLDHAFANRAAAEKFLFSCYSFLPDPTDPFHYPAYFTSKNEFDYGVSTWIYPSPAPSICRGEQNSSNPLLDYWSGKNGGISMFKAIRTCNIFLENINQPRDIDEAERARWIAEAKFLKAYYHFFLMQLYGPVPLIRENSPLSATPDELKVFREPVDECVTYISELLTQAAKDLPLFITNTADEDGRITQPVALAVKAKLLAWAASPLFNGNQDYNGWTDSRGKQMISTTYSKEKWERAAVALKNAIDTCHLAGLKLYTFNKAASPQAYNMVDAVVLTMNTRKAVTEKWNSGVIWSSTESFASGKGGMSSFPALGNMQQILYPVMYTQDQGKTVAYAHASFSMAELFYTNKGIPIDEDISWKYDSRYSTRIDTKESGNESYIATGEATASLNFDREARFYASLGFDRGYFELSTATTNGGASFSPYLKLRAGEAGNLSAPTGYYVKKLIAFESSCSQGSSSRSYSGYDYRFPLIRLSDLYLLYSEALNEVYDTPNSEVYNWVDQVRAVAGLTGVVESWRNSKFPSRPTVKDEMRKIIQRERMIELAFEGQQFWDIRRWKLADTYFTVIPKGWTQTGKTADQYYVIRNTGEARKFSSREYLWPISISDLRINNNLVQTYGW